MKNKINIFNKIYSNNEDPEFSDIINNFINKELLTHINLSDKEIALVVISSIIANQSTKLYKDILCDVLEILSPVELKETIYQSTIYIGLTKSYEFLEITNKYFKKAKIDLPLASQSTINNEDRLETGYQLQVRNFSKEFIDNSIANTPNDQKYIWDLISSFAYGDFYTRNGLNDKQRELITFSFILSLRGCENQLKIHSIGNIKMGNTKDKLVDVVTILIPFIGFPRMHNALAIINQTIE